MKYIILYEYYSITLGCECCHDYSSEIHIYKEENVDRCYESNFECKLIENEEQLREFINSVDPYYNGFDVHPDTVYFGE